MSFRVKILATLVFVSVAPLLLLSWVSYEIVSAEIGKTVERAQRSKAADLARTTAWFVEDRIRELRLAADYLPLDALGPMELTKILQIPYRQLPSVTILVVLNEHGRALSGTVADEATRGQTAGSSLPVASSKHDTQRFSRHVPLAAALRHGAAVSVAYGSDPSGARVAVAVRTNGKPVRILAAEISLQRLLPYLDTPEAQAGFAVVMNSAGEPLLAAGDYSSLAPENHKALVVKLKRGGSFAHRAKTTGGQQHYAASAPVHQLPWWVLVGEDADQAQRPIKRVQLYAAFWAGVALIVALVLGLLLSRSLSQPIHSLSHAADSLRQGDFEYRVAHTHRDELGSLAAAFNSMADGIQSRDAEIKAWNQELQKRVQEKTAALEAAQNQILRSRRLTALASMSAGLAHQLNNPLTGIVGLVKLTQVKCSSDPRVSENLEMVLEQTRRMGQLLHDFRRFSDEERHSAGLPFDLATPIKAALTAHDEALRSSGIHVSTDVDDSIPRVHGNAEQIQQATFNLIENAIEAMPQGGDVAVEIAPLGSSAVRLRIRDSGNGIPVDVQDRIFDPFFTTKQATNQVGMGLSIAHSIVHAHEGKISVASDPQQGTVVDVILPAAPGEAHMV